MKRYLLIALVLSACMSPDKYDSKARATCDMLGYQPGNAAWDKCMAAEKSARATEYRDND